MIVHDAKRSNHGPFHQKTPSEIWDDDFEFQKNNERDQKGEDDGALRLETIETPSKGSRWEMTDSTYDDYTGKDPGPSRILKFPPSSTPVDISDPLRAWSESPSTPHSRSRRRQSKEENWDDDFLDKFDSPVRVNPSQRRHTLGRISPDGQQENWDMEIGMELGSRVETSPRSKRSRLDASWDSSDEDEDAEQDGHEFGFARRTRTEEEEEDRTVTAKSRRKPLGALNTDIPPVPPLPAFLPTIHSGEMADLSQPSPFPRSPTLSVFSIPTTNTSHGGRESTTYGSTAHLALRRTHSAGSSSPSQHNIVGRFPPISPSRMPRERRRLRKKSRPPHLDDNIIELEDRTEVPPANTATELPLGSFAYRTLRPVTPDNRPSTPPPSTPSMGSPMEVDSSSPLPSSSPISPTSKSPLLTRIGSMKRWSVGVRKKRASTGPSEIAANPQPVLDASPELDRLDNKTPRPHSFAPTTPPRPPPNRFFRGTSGGVVETSPRVFQVFKVSELKETSKISSSNGLRTDIDSNPPSPRSTRLRVFRTRQSPSSVESSATGDIEAGIEKDGDVKMALPSTPAARLRPRRPSHAPSALQMRTQVPRHVSGSAIPDAFPVPSVTFRSVSSSAASASVEDLGYTDKKEGARGFMGNVRRISLGGQKKHRRSKSGGGEDSTMLPVTTVEPVPPLPKSLPASADSLGGNKQSIDTLLPAAEIVSPTSSGATVQKVQTNVTASISLPVDLSSPVDLSASPPTPPEPRRSMEPMLVHSKSSSFVTRSPNHNSPARLSSSPQISSLGRASPLAMGASAPANVHRRSSLGDLKIPSRISRAQDGLKRDLNRVREFASHVEQMKELRATYYNLANQVQAIIDLPSPSRATSPTGLFNFSRPSSRARSYTNPPMPSFNHRALAVTFQTIDAKYRIAWECADLLVDLGNGDVSDVSSSPPTIAVSRSSPGSSGPIRVKNRERAVTLAGDEGKPSFEDIGANAISPPQASPPTLLSWRASTGRHDLNHRQLFLLKEMLNNAESAKEGTKLDIPPAPSQIAPQWPHKHHTEAAESTLTLPTEESAGTGSVSSPQKRRPGSKLGMTGIRDMLRSFKRNHSRTIQPEGAQSSVTLSTESSVDTNTANLDNHPYGFTRTNAGLPIPSQFYGRRRSKTSTGPESVRSTAGNHPHMSAVSITHKPSPRRPSLASLFRLGQKHKESPTNSTNRSLDKVIDISKQSDSTGRKSRSTTEDEDEESDWDRMDSASDLNVELDAIANGVDPKGTLKLRKKKRPSYPFDGSPHSRSVAAKHSPLHESQVSLDSKADKPIHQRPTRLSNVDENNPSTSSSGHSTPGPSNDKRPRSRGKDRLVVSSVRTVPVKAPVGIPTFDVAPIPDFKLAMTPENIKPLLENARVVTARLKDCVSEVKVLLDRVEVKS